MADIRSVVIPYFVVCAAYIVYGATWSKTFYMHAGKRCTNTSASLTAASKFACCRVCMEKDACTMVSFNKVTRTCELSETDIDDTDALVEEAAWDVYYKQSKLVALTIYLSKFMQETSD